MRTKCVVLTMMIVRMIAQLLLSLLWADVSQSMEIHTVTPAYRTHNMNLEHEVTVCWNSFEMESSQCNENVWWPFDLTPFYSKDIKRMHLDLKLISILHFYFVWPLNKTQQFRVISRNLRLKIVANCAFGDPNGFILIQVW